MSAENWVALGVFVTIITMSIGVRRFTWWLEDRAWAKAAEKRLDAANRGIDTSFMDGMP